MPQAIIDLGTNTFHLLIADESKNILYEEKMPVRLGVGGINQNLLTAEGMARALQCLTQFKNQCEALGVTNIKAIGTSALRNANNSNEFIATVKNSTGIHILIIDGAQEAQYIYQGVCAAIPLGTEKHLIMDIGGGSVEFIIAHRHTIFFKQSFEVGGQRLFENFHQVDPIPIQALSSLHTYLKNTLEPLKPAILTYSPTTIIGSSGTFETLSDMHCARLGIPNEKLPQSPLTIENFYALKDLLTRSDKMTRMSLPGMLAWRAEMIVCTCALIETVLAMHPFKAMKVSRYSLKEGVLFG